MSYYQSLSEGHSSYNAHSDMVFSLVNKINIPKSCHVVGCTTNRVKNPELKLSRPHQSLCGDIPVIEVVKLS